MRYSIYTVELAAVRRCFVPDIRVEPASEGELVGG